jgi:hypothetical protein
LPTTDTARRGWGQERLDFWPTSKKTCSAARRGNDTLFGNNGRTSSPALGGAADAHRRPPSAARDPILRHTESTAADGVKTPLRGADGGLRPSRRPRTRSDECGGNV